MSASLPLPIILESRASSVVVDNARSHFISVSSSANTSHDGKEGEDLPPLCFYRENLRKNKKPVNPKSFGNRSKSFPSSEKQADELICRWDSMPSSSSSSSSVSSIAARSSANRANVRGRDKTPLRRIRSSDDALALAAALEAAAAAENDGLEMDEIFSEGKVDQEPRRPKRRNSDSFSTLNGSLGESLDIF